MRRRFAWGDLARTVLVILGSIIFWGALIVAGLVLFLRATLPG